MPKKNSARNTAQLYQLLIAQIRDPATTLADLGNALACDPDWEIIDSNERDKYADSADPTQCDGGTWWSCRTAAQTYAVRPKTADIKALLATIPYPTGVGRPECTAPCTAFKECQVAWDIMRHKKTLQWGLFASKECLWTCRKPCYRPRRNDPEKPLPPNDIT
jgi:hypothetical protein